MIKAENISKQFNGLEVLKNVSLEVIPQLLDTYEDLGIKTGIGIIDTITKIPFNILNRTTSTNNVLDPTKVVYTTLQNASSIAGLFLTTDCVIANK